MKGLGKICFGVKRILARYLVNSLRGYRATSLSTYDFFSALYTTFLHNLITEKLLDLIEQAFKDISKYEGTLYLACNDKRVFFTSAYQRG